MMCVRLLRSAILACVGLLFLTAANANAQTTFVSVDTPPDGGISVQPFAISGWAVDLASTSGPGVHHVAIWAQPPNDPTLGIHLGNVLVDQPRADVAAAHGAQFLNSGFSFMVRGVVPNTYTIRVFPYSLLITNYGPARVLSREIRVNTQLNIDLPAHLSNVVQPFTLTGWAIDLAAATGSGVPLIGVWARNVNLSTPTLFYPTVEINRPDIGTFFGNAQFNPSGYSLSVNGLAPGVYDLDVWAFSSVAWAYTLMKSIRVTVDAPASAPTFSPTPGTYATPQSVTLSSTTPGATIRYTTNGSEPTVSSTLYTGPITMVTGLTTTVKAKAFASGYVASATTSGAYQIGPPDVTAPTIQATVMPAANPAGWHNTDVVVRFFCDDTPGTGVEECPSDVHVTTEGAGQAVTRSARDLAGNVTPVTVTLNIDKTPPSLILPEPPPASTDLDEIAIAATVSDTLSLVDHAACNAVPASVSNGTFSCTIGLEPGRNPILVVASDVAGNRAVLPALTIYGDETGPAPLSLHVSPNSVTLLVDEARRLVLVDNHGRDVPDAVWVSSDPMIATVEADGTVTAVAAGTATISAAEDTLSVEAIVTVLGGSTMPAGTLSWEAGSQPGHYNIQVVEGTSVRGATPYYVLEAPVGVNGPYRARSIASNGEVSWDIRLPIPDVESVSVATLGNSLGGILLEVASYDGMSDPEILSVDPDGQPVWSYRGKEAHIIGQAGNGTVFVSERQVLEGGVHVDGWITILDGEAGTVRARVPLAESTSFTIHGDCISVNGGHLNRTRGGLQGAPAIDAVGTLHFLAYSSDTHHDALPCNVGFRTWDRRLELWSISSAGAKSVVLVDQDVYSGPSSSSGPGRVFTGGEIVPDDQGVFFTWSEQPSGTIHIGRNSSGVMTLGQLAEGVTLAVAGEANTLFATGSGVVLALDANDGSVRWSQPASSIVASTAGGGVAVQDADVLKNYDANGTLLSQTYAREGAIPHPFGGRFAFTAGSVSHEMGEPIDWANVQWKMQGGSKLKGSGAPNCVPPLIRGRKLNSLANSYSLVDINLDTFASPFFNATELGIIDQKAHSWNLAGYDRLISRNFAGNTLMKWFVFPAGERTFGEMIQTKDLGRAKTTSRYGIPDESFGLVFNRGLSVGPLSPDLAKGKFRLTVVHEIGHLIGLDHVQSGCTIYDSVMIENYQDSIIIDASPTLNDRDGVTKLKASRK